MRCIDISTWMLPWERSVLCRRCDIYCKHHRRWRLCIATRCGELRRDCARMVPLWPSLRLPRLLDTQEDLNAPCLISLINWNWSTRQQLASVHRFIRKQIYFVDIVPPLRWCSCSDLLVCISWSSSTTKWLISSSNSAHLLDLNQWILRSCKIILTRQCS